jgi:single stranded DNA-binding protein
MDINKVWLSGVVVTQPVLTQLSGKTPLCIFSVQVNEQFKDKKGQAQIKPNILRIECLGRNAKMAYNRVRHGGRYTLDGYIRQDVMDGQDQVRVRLFAIYPDESIDHVNYKEGLKRAAEILKNSVDRQAALEKINEILNKE